MIITVTANPAVDAVYELGREISIKSLNRSADSRIFAGGKGINVSRAVISALWQGEADGNAAVKTVALAGGFSGRLLSDMLAAEGIELTAVETSAETRINVCAVSPSGEVCEINAPGGPVSEAELNELKRRVLSFASAGDVVVIAGSLPKLVSGSPGNSAGNAFLAQFIAEVKQKGAFVILDCSGEALSCAVNSETPPDMIKPNLDELCELSKIDSEGILQESVPESDKTEMLFKCAETASERLAESGITVLATLGSAGAVFTHAGEPYKHIRQISYKAERIANIKGAGDTFLGVFACRRFIFNDSVEASLDMASRAAALHVSGGKM